MIERKEIIAIIDYAREEMVDAIAMHRQHHRKEYLTEAAQWAAIISALLADLG
jgi:hypothetical protein